jgi:hypothetical protein
MSISLGAHTNQCFLQNRRSSLLSIRNNNVVRRRCPFPKIMNNSAYPPIKERSYRWLKLHHPNTTWNIVINHSRLPVDMTWNYFMSSTWGIKFPWRKSLEQGQSQPAPPTPSTMTHNPALHPLHLRSTLSTIASNISILRLGDGYCASVERGAGSRDFLF